MYFQYHPKQENQVRPKMIRVIHVILITLFVAYGIKLLLPNKSKPALQKAEIDWNKDLNNPNLNPYSGT